MDGGSEELLAFKAGLMKAVAKGDKKFTVEPDPRKGMLSLSREGDGALHVMWKVRGTNRVEEDVMVFPDNQDFTKVETGNQQDRVYLLQFKNSSRRFFFWMQDPNKETDAENCRKLNEYIRNPPNPSMGNLAGADQQSLMQLLSQFQGQGGQAIPMESLQSILRNGGSAQQGGQGSSSGRRNENSSGSNEGKEDEEDEAKRDGDSNSGNDNDQVTPAAPTSTTVAPVSTGQNSMSQEDIQRAFAGMQTMLQQAQSQRPRLTPNLDQVFDASVMQELLSDTGVRRELLQFLPDEHQNEDELWQAVGSPQVRQAMMALSHALQSDNFNTVMSNFMLDPMDGETELQRGDGIGAFLRALQERANRQNGNTNNSNREDEDFYN